MNTSRVGEDGTQAASSPEYDQQFRAADIYLDTGTATISEDCAKVWKPLLSVKNKCS